MCSSKCTAELNKADSKWTEFVNGKEYKWHPMCYFTSGLFFASLFQTFLQNHSYAHSQDTERGVPNFFKGLQDSVAVVKIINLCRLITVPENKIFFVYCVFCYSSEMFGFCPILSPRNAIHSIKMGHGQTEIVSFNGQYGKCKR